MEIPWFQPQLSPGLALTLCLHHPTLDWPGSKEFGLCAGIMFLAEFCLFWWVLVSNKNEGKEMMRCVLFAYY